MEVTYDEVRQWARWLIIFTARDLADAMGVDVSVGERGVRALIFHGICERTGELPGPDGPEDVIEYLPLPPGPTHRPRQTPPEVVAFFEAGGDPLRVERGFPVPARRHRDNSLVGRRRPGRRQMTRERRREQFGA